MNPLARVVYRLFANFWSEDPPETQWQLVLRGEDPAMRRYRHILALLPANPRCRFCNAPFRGPLVPLMQLIDRGPSRLNPRYCRMCLETIPVGGAEIEHTMLFADVRGSTTLAEQMGAGAFGQLMNRFYIAGTEVLTHSDALIERLAGDQLIGLYIPGFAGAEHPHKAVQAGEALLQATGYGQPEGPWIQVGVGVHTGVAFVGAVGTDGGLTNITALGDAVNIAARLSSLAGPGEMLVSEDAALAAGLPTGHLERRLLALKGRTEPVTVYVQRLVATPEA
jgi:class 3 adenylate cyclase